ncbi:MAG: hypothetical protein RI560_04190 [Natronomonas sp.]|uniref:DUF7311 family protein n=1 Tax=Natronomonas sp. TaxID=2184060 RepID=UPI0028708F81|nr:hypothetical protein [Natronomonas sp.]MDR9380855.1 hypothetical protein [Natronomonas sp.]MDR9429608.1 hypothetical protein [Natronomonas sp.]
MIRVVLAVALGAALFGIALPSAEHADRDRAAALAIDELERINATAERLAAENDPGERSDAPPATTIVLDPPEPTFADPGRFRIDDDELRWIPANGPNTTVETAVPVRIDAPTIVADRTRLRLSLVRLDGEAVVRARLDRTRV